jgi:hypothetical protein
MNPLPYIWIVSRIIHITHGMCPNATSRWNKDWCTIKPKGNTTCQDWKQVILCSRQYKHRLRTTGVLQNSSEECGILISYTICTTETYMQWTSIFYSKIRICCPLSLLSLRICPQGLHLKFNNFPNDYETTHHHFPTQQARRIDILLTSLATSKHHVTWFLRDIWMLIF